jgi:hypothetical protein
VSASRSVGLGDIARDRVTGFEGVVTARTQWLGNCDRLTLQPRAVDGKLPESATFDEPHCEFVETTEFSAEGPTETGGPRPEPAASGGTYQPSYVPPYHSPNRGGGR